MSKWTKEPPTEPGWYWWRSDTDKPKILEVLWLGEQGKSLGLYVRGGSRNLYSLGDWDGGEWWPERIKEPPK